MLKSVATTMQPCLTPICQRSLELCVKIIRKKSPVLGYL